MRDLLLLELGDRVETRLQAGESVAGNNALLGQAREVHALALGVMRLARGRSRASRTGGRATVHEERGRDAGVEQVLLVGRDRGFVDLEVVVGRTGAVVLYVAGSPAAQTTGVLGDLLDEIGSKSDLGRIQARKGLTGSGSG